MGRPKGSKNKAKKSRRKGVNLGRMLAKVEEQKAKQNRTDFWKPSEGKNVIRLMPPWAEEGDSAELFYREVYIHWNVPPGAEDQTFMLCPKKMDLGRCYVCDQVDELYGSRDPADIELAKEIRSRQRFFSNVIDLNDVGGKDPKVQVWSYGPMIFDDLIGYFCDSEYGDITDPDEGFNITIERTGVSRDTSYKVRLSRHSSSFSDNDFDEGSVYAALKDLDQLELIGESYQLLEYDAQQAKYEGDEVSNQIGYEDDDDELDEDEFDEDEFDGELDDEDDDEADEIEAKLQAAVKSRKKKSVKKRRKSA